MVVVAALLGFFAGIGGGFISGYFGPVLLERRKRGKLTVKYENKPPFRRKIQSHRYDKDPTRTRTELFNRYVVQAQDRE